MEGGGEDVPPLINQRKRLAFLAALAAAGPRGIARERIMLMLWPESTTDRARGALNQLLYVVRQAFGDESVVGTDELRLDAGIVASDVSDFNEAMANGDMAAAIAVYAGPLLDAFHVSGVPELERWIEQKRQELARSYQSALAQFVAQKMATRDYAAAVVFAERLAAADPLSERATVLLMQALAATGDVAAALERAHVHASVVRRELNVDVHASVSALAARLRSDASAVSDPAVEPPRPSSQEFTARAASPAGSVARQRTRWATWTAAAVVFASLGVLVAMRRPRDRDREFVIVSDFSTPAADSQIAGTLTFATRQALGSSRALAVAPDVRISAARQRLGVPATARLTVEVARQIAIGDGIRAVIAESLTPFGKGYVMSLRLVSAASGEVLASVEQDGVTEGRVFIALDTLTRRLRERSGEDLQATRAQPSILAVTSSSLEAMTDYVTALRMPRDSLASAVALLHEAVRLDTGFASALWQLSRLGELAGPASESEHRALLARAWNHRAGLTQYEQMRLEIAYKYSPNGQTPDLARHVEVLRNVVEQYPNASDANILGGLYLGQRDLDAAERTYRYVIALDPTSIDGYSGLITTLLRAKQFRKARSATDDFARRFPRKRYADDLDAIVSYAEGRRDRSRDIMRRLSLTPGTMQALGRAQAAILDLLEGHVAAFDRVMSANDSAAGPRQSERALFTNRLPATYWVMQRPDDGLAMLESVAGDPSVRHMLQTAEFYAQLGRPDSARTLLTALGKRDRTIYWQGTDTLPVSAWIDLAEGRAREAAVKFRQSLRLSGSDAPSQVTRDAEIGLAFERAGLPDSAIAVYEHYLNASPGWELDAFKLVWILNHVAPLYESRGDRRKAKAAYLRMAELWKDADPELQPRVAHARERAAALR